MSKNILKKISITFIIFSLCFSTISYGEDNVNNDSLKINEEFNKNLEKLEKSQKDTLETLVNIDDTINHIKGKNEHGDNDTFVKVQELSVAKAKSDYTNSLKTNDKDIISNAKKVLLNELEKTVPLICMPNFHKDLNYKPDPQNTKCEDIVKELLALYPYSPIGLCAKYGYKDKRCIDGYSHIIISNAKESSSNDKKEIPELKDFFKKIDNIKIPKLKTDYFNAKNLYKTKNSINNFMKVISIGDKIVRNLCREKRERYSDKCITCKNQNNLELGDFDIFNTISDEEKSKSKKNEDTNQNLKQVDKIIYLSRDCQDFLKEISSFEETYPSSICEQNGIYSPKCLDALRVWPQYIKSKYSLENNNRKPVEMKPTTDPNAFESF